MLLIFGLAVVIQSQGFFHVTNANAAVTQTVGGSAHTAALITDSHGSPVQVAHTAHTDSRIQQTTIHVKAKKHEVQKMLADNEMEEQRVQSGYGSILDAEKVLKRLLSKEPKISKDAKCDPPRLLVLDRCICPAGSKWDASSKSCTQTLGEMFFYMYRAQSDNNYIMSNIDMADLAGVMYYLHNEIAKNNLTEGVRMNGITRILRFLVTMRPSPELASQMKVFMPFVAFDEGRCSVPGCNKLWEHYGFAVGCQKQGASTGFAYSEDSSGAWFSLPGACPVLPVGSKDQSCKTKYPGGGCSDLSVSQTCTYSIKYAGEIFLDELEGIDDFAKWQQQGNREYDPIKDRGHGTSFWDFRNSAAWCARRMQCVQSLLKAKYPLLPEDIPPPSCF